MTGAATSDRKHGSHWHPTFRFQEDLYSGLGSPLPLVCSLLRRFPLHELALKALEPSAESHQTDSPNRLTVRRSTGCSCRLSTIGRKIFSGFGMDDSGSLCFLIWRSIDRRI